MRARLKEFGSMIWWGELGIIFPMVRFKAGGRSSLSSPLNWIELLVDVFWITLLHISVESSGHSVSALSVAIVDTSIGEIILGALLLWDLNSFGIVLSTRNLMKIFNSSSKKPVTKDDYYSTHNRDRTDYGRAIPIPRQINAEPPSTPREVTVSGRLRQEEQEPTVM